MFVRISCFVLCCPNAVWDVWFHLYGLAPDEFVVVSFWWGPCFVRFSVV